MNEWDEEDLLLTEQDEAELDDLRDETRDFWLSKSRGWYEAVDMASDASEKRRAELIAMRRASS